MTAEEKLLVARLKATYTDVDEMQKVVEQFKADRAALLSEQDSMNYEFGKLKALLARAADALECCHSTHQTGYGWLIAELRKAAE